MLYLFYYEFINHDKYQYFSASIEVFIVKSKGQTSSSECTLEHDLEIHNG